MFRISSRGLKAFGVLCLTVLLFVYSLQQANLNYSENTSKKSQHDVNLSPHLEKSGENATWNVLISLVNLDQHPKILRDFNVCLSSICKYSSINLTLYVVTDNKSQGKAERVIGNLKEDLCKEKVNVKYHDIALVAQALQPFIDVFHDLFTSNPKSYFSGALFFLSIISDTLFRDISRLIILDADLKFRTDIKQLFDKFEDFSRSNLIGIAYELQPVYRHITWQYRRGHPHTKVGEPPPDGNPGFNSGVLLMNLARMRISTLYKEYLSDHNRLRRLSEKYYFKGHLGDQGFYTLLSFDHPELFHILPCIWNRQLCRWWENKGYEGVFRLYHVCEGNVNVYHGNCGTAIPND